LDTPTAVLYHRLDHWMLILKPNQQQCSKLYSDMFYHDTELYSK